MGARGRAAWIPGAILTRERAVGLLDLGLAGVLKQAVAIQAAMQSDTDGPRLREDLRIIDGGFVLNGVVVDHAVPLGHPQSFAVEVAGHVEPGLVVVIADVDDQGVAIPVTARIAQPEVAVLGMGRAIGINHAIVQFPFEGHGDHLGRLENLERKIEIHDAGDAGHVAFPQRIGGLAILRILGSLFGGPGLIRDRTAGYDGAAGQHVEAGDVILQIRRRGAGGLPDALQVRFPVGGAGQRQLRAKCRSLS